LIFVVLLIGLVIPDSDLHAPSKSSRVRRDHRSISTALEVYFLDHGSYPTARPMADILSAWSLEVTSEFIDAGGRRANVTDWGAGDSRHGLTTPVAYITSLVADPYSPIRGLPFAYWSNGESWILISTGPDSDYDVLPQYDLLVGTHETVYNRLVSRRKIWDPTNGADSSGDIVRISGQWPGNRSGSLR